MIKKIIIGLLLMCGFIGNVFADPFAPPPIDSSLDGSPAYQSQQGGDNNNGGSELCDSKDCLNSVNFTIGVDNFSPGFKTKSGSMTVATNSTERINFLLGTIIQKLMIALGVLAVLIMTVGAGYIILYHGQDELLSKGKSIFMSGITALVVALSSYALVAILRYILYK